MLRTLLAAAVLILTTVSCSKNNNDGDNNNPTRFFSAKIDGVKKEFNFSVVAQLDIDSPQSYHLFVNGGGGTSSDPLPNFYVEINTDAPIVAKTYQTIQSQFKWEADANYWLDGATIYEVYDHDFLITITSITSTEVSGTFSGTLEEGSTGQVISITEGMFSAPVLP